MEGDGEGPRTVPGFWVGEHAGQGIEFPTCCSPALTSFSLPGANGFPCCSKDSVDIMDTQ